MGRWWWRTRERVRQTDRLSGVRMIIIVRVPKYGVDMIEWTRMDGFLPVAEFQAVCVSRKGNQGREHGVGGYLLQE